MNIIYRHKEILSFLVLYFLLGILTWDIDPPMDVISWSNTFLTDEGWYSRWAQNLVKFDLRNEPFDFVYLPGGPLHNFLLYGVFSLFGPTVFVIRMYALVLTLGSLTLFYLILLKGMSKRLAVLGVVVTAASINFFSYARMGFIENTALFFSLSAVFFYVRKGSCVKNIVLSLAFAFLAVFSKAHFLSVFVAIVLLVCIEFFREDKKNKIQLLVAGGAVALACLAISVIYLAMFSQEYKEFQELVTVPILGGLTFIKILANEWQMLWGLRKNTHHFAFILSLILLFYALVRGRYRFRITFLKDKTSRIFFFWLVIGLIYMGILSYQAPRYFMFGLFPMTFFALKILSLNRKWLITVIALHLALQTPYYYRWFSRESISTHVRSFREMAEKISAGSDSPVGVLGWSSSTLSLYHPRIRAFDLSHVPSGYSLCQRIEHHRPRFLLKVVEKNQVDTVNCPIVLNVKIVSRHQVYDGHSNTIDLMELEYN